METVLLWQQDNRDSACMVAEAAGTMEEVDSIWQQNQQWECQSIVTMHGRGGRDGDYSGIIIFLTACLWGELWWVALRRVALWRGRTAY